MSPVLQMALDLLVHGLQHFINGDPLDNRLAVLHLDQSIELSLKERVRVGGRPIMKPGGKESISLYDAYKQLDELGVIIPEKPNLELLHEQRNQIQHLFSSPDENTTRFHVDNALFFLSRFYSEEYAMILLDYIPAPLLAHHKLVYLEDIDKLIGLFESAEKCCKANKFPEGISSLTAALDLTIQLSAEKKNLEIIGDSTEKIVDDAEAKKILNKRGIAQARIILKMNTDISNKTNPSEKDFLAVIANFRKDTQ
jgi:hypothetical protein